MCKYCLSKNHTPDECNAIKPNEYPISDIVKWTVTQKCNDEIAKNIINWMK